jgi:hypothetical protein
MERDRGGMDGRRETDRRDRKSYIQIDCRRDTLLGWTEGGISTNYTCAQQKYWGPADLFTKLVLM